MNRVYIALALAAFTVTGAGAQSIPEKSGVNSVLGIAPKTEDFVKELAVSDMFEIGSSKLAVERGDADSKAFAEKMIKDHTETTSELKELVSSGKVKADLPSAMDSAHQSKLDKLKSLNGADFNKQYDADQVSAHKDAVSLFERYAKGGDNDALKAFAAKTLPHLQGHLKMAQDLK
jgi:putative membrane protein